MKARWRSSVGRALRHRPIKGHRLNEDASASPYTDQERRRLADLFHDLTTGPGRGCLLVTCRPGETGLRGAQRQELHGLARPDSLWLLHRILQRDGLSLDDPRLTKEKLDPLLRDLAVQLKDQVGLGQAAQNIGVVCQLEGEAARERDDEPAARRHFEAAHRSVEESLRMRQSLNNKPDEAASSNQLARIHLCLGDLPAAESHTHESRQIRESLDLKEAFRDYNTLSEIAKARGDPPAAAEWAKKRDHLLEELKRRARAGFGGDDLGPGEEGALATLEQNPAPFPDFVAYLRQLATGQLPPIPASLPTELRQILEPLAQAIQEARAG